jgi:membrane protease YdiL (CAAX protease family)
MTQSTLVRPRPAADVTLLTALFAGAVCVRVAVAGGAGAESVTGALTFAAVLGGCAVALRPAVGATRKAVLVGLFGAIVLVLPAVAVHGLSGTRTISGYAGWALLTTVVATAEEAFLRGALFGVLSRWRGPDVAVVGAAVAFALLHVPLYGWGVVPLDLAVGLLLGALRLLTGGWAAPAVAHVGADLVGWWVA